LSEGEAKPRVNEKRSKRGRLERREGSLEAKGQRRTQCVGGPTTAKTQELNNGEVTVKDLEGGHGLPTAED